VVLEANDPNGVVPFDCKTKPSGPVYVVNPDTHLIYELDCGNDELVDTCIYQPVPEFCQENLTLLSGHPNNVVLKFIGPEGALQF